MSIDHNAFSSKFKLSTIEEREKKAAFKKWQAVFYSLRQLIWNETKGNILSDAIGRSLALRDRFWCCRAW